MKLEHSRIFNIEGALRGMRNPMNSWGKADSKYDFVVDRLIIGKNDLDLARRLIVAGPEHRKFLRQIFWSVDVTAPRYWWIEFDTYNVGPTSNSCSTMHKMCDHEFTENDFEIGGEDVGGVVKKSIERTCKELNSLRELYLETKNFTYVKMMKKLLPESYLQKRTITMNAENMLNIYRQRRTHRLDEWRMFVEFMNNALELNGLQFIFGGDCVEVQTA